MKNYLLLLFAVFFSGTTIAQGTQDEKAKQILDKMSAKYKNMNSFKASFNQTLTNKAAGFSDEYSGEIAVKGEMFRLSVPEQEIYNNGTTVWTYISEDNQVHESFYEPSDEELTPSNIFDLYKKDFKYAYNGALSTPQYHTIDLEPETRNDQYKRVRLNIDRDTYLLHSYEILDNENNLYVFNITDFQANANLSDAYFVFDKSKHPGVDVIVLK